MAVMEPKYTAVAPWFGSNRMLAPKVGELLKGCEWVAVVFAGGMSEVLHLDARTVLVNDKHRHVINLAWTMKHPYLGPKLYRRLRRLSQHPDELQAAQYYCKLNGLPPVALMDEPDINAATNYFVTAWMGRNGKAGTKGEFSGGVSVRYESGGGDSAVRFRNAVLSIPALRRLLRFCNFSTDEFRVFLSKCKDKAGHGIYCDPPFPGPGDGYKHTFTREDHQDLAKMLSAYKQTKVVCRFYDHPFVRELYPETHWEWIHLVGRKATNDSASEVLLINKRESR